MSTALIIRSRQQRRPRTVLDIDPSYHNESTASTLTSTPLLHLQSPSCPSFTTSFPLSIIIQSCPSPYASQRRIRRPTTVCSVDVTPTNTKASFHLSSRVPSVSRSLRTSVRPLRRLLTPALLRHSLPRPLINQNSLVFPPRPSTTTPPPS